MAATLGYKNVYRDPYGYPEWQGRGLPIESAPAGLAQTSEEPKAPGPLYGFAMIWTLLGIFAGGMALNLTPCVYPLIPITVSYFGGQAAKGGEGQGKLVAHGLCYMMGLALTNSVLGVAASLTGGLMGAMLQNPIVLIVVAAVLVFFATSLFGLWEMRLPSGLTQAAAKSYTGYLRKPLYGTHPWGGCRPLHRPIRAGAPHLGCQHGKPMARVFDLLHLESRAGSSSLHSRHVLRATGETPPVGRLDDLGKKANGLGPGRQWLPIS